MISIDLITGTPTKVIFYTKHLFPATFFCFFALVACLFSKPKKRSHANFRFAWLLVLFKMLFLHFRYSVYPLVGVSAKCPRVVESIARKIYFIVGQSAVNASTHHQPPSCRTFCRASSLLSATTSNTPSKTNCVRAL